MWQPDPEWCQLPGGMGASSGGMWTSVLGGRTWVIKRISAPGPEDPDELSAPTHGGYWRREADVAHRGLVLGTPGLRSPEVGQVEEDPEGITIWFESIAQTDVPGPFAARALGRFGAADLGDSPWLAESLLVERIRRTEAAGGWRTLERTTVADVADRIWHRRFGLLDRFRALPRVSSHGDPVRANLRAISGDDVVALDWGSLGHAPIGADLGYFALSAREDFDLLLAVYLEGLAAGGIEADPEEAEFGARMVAVYTVLSRAEWALSRVDAGEGALAGKYRHPSVAPYIRAMQRQFPQIEALL